MSELSNITIQGDMTKGDTVFKYGEDIGVMIDDVKKGHHLHTHNCKTKRW